MLALAAARRVSGARDEALALARKAAAAATACGAVPTLEAALVETALASPRAAGNGSATEHASRALRRRAAALGSARARTFLTRRDRAAIVAGPDAGPIDLAQAPAGNQGRHATEPRPPTAGPTERESEGG